MLQQKVSVVVPISGVPVAYASPAVEVGVVHVVFGEFPIVSAARNSFAVGVIVDR